MAPSATIAAVSKALLPLAPGPILAVSIRHREQGGDPVAVADLPARPCHGPCWHRGLTNPPLGLAACLQTELRHRGTGSASTPVRILCTPSRAGLRPAAAPGVRPGGRSRRAPPNRRHGIREGHRTTRSGGLPVRRSAQYRRRPDAPLSARLRAAPRARCVTS